MRSDKYSRTAAPTCQFMNMENPKNLVCLSRCCSGRIFRHQLVPHCQGECAHPEGQRILRQVRVGFRGWNSSSTDCFGSLIRERSLRSFFCASSFCRKRKHGRSGRVPRSAVLGHAETLLAAKRHLITNESCAAHFLHPGAATGAKLHGGERIALIIKRREASNAASGVRAWGKFLHSRDVLRTATEPMTAKEIASGVLAAANITDAYQAQRQCTKCRRSAWGRRL